ncbi:uncharacterized protein LOC114753358 [Neltuma alba]|uniref:uncharacterized protein LOC114753358 n=1 Tax=Neltuma alba TaxID=207710 RepID=UPI0010A43E3D|nr:uncharacterized protein LOC114753358 [Prosopis alba]
MRDYLATIKSICDHLAMLGQRVADTDHVSYILNGLSAEYESVIAVINGAHGKFTLTEVHTMLIDAKTRQKTFLLNASSQANTNDTVFHAAYAPRTIGGRGSTPPPQPPQPPYSQPRALVGRGRGRVFSFRPSCQICHKIGHTADKCYFRYDFNYSNQTNPVYTNSSAPPSAYHTAYNYAPVVGDYGVSNVPSACEFGTHTSNQGEIDKNVNVAASSSSPIVNNIAEIVTSQGSTTSQVVDHSSNAQVYLATPSAVNNDGAWYFDSGATQHVANSTDKLQQIIPFNGTGTVEVDFLAHTRLNKMDWLRDGIGKLLKQD